MSQVVKDRNLVRIVVYAPIPVNEKLQSWMKKEGISSESYAMLHAPRKILFPEQHADTPGRNILEAELQAIKEQLGQLQAIQEPKEETPKGPRWMTTREAFDSCEHDLSWERFRKLPEPELLSRFGLIGDRARRKSGHRSKWLYFVESTPEAHK